MERFDIFGGLEKLGIKVKPNADDLYKKEEAKSSKSGDGGKKAPKPEDFIFMRKITCPVCSKEFESASVRTSKIALTRTDTDLRPYYEPYDPLLYDVIVCTSCGLAAMNATFMRISDKQMDIILSNITPVFQSRTYPLVYSFEDAAERYKLALLCATLKNVKDSEKAMLCLKLAWLMREMKDNEMEQLYLQNAHTGFLSAYGNESFPLFGMDEHTLCYLLGDICRRIGNYEDAMRFISRVVVAKQVKSRLKDRALEVRDLIREARGAENPAPVAEVKKK